MNYHKIFKDAFSPIALQNDEESFVKSVAERKNVMENKKKINIRKPVVVICACAFFSLGTIAVAAESPEFNQFIYTTTGFVIDPDKIVFATPIPQYPIDGFSSIEDVGNPIAEGLIKEEIPTDMYTVELKESAENKFTIEKIAYGNGQTMVLGDGFELEENQCVKITIDADFTAEYHTDRNGELVAVGYIYNDIAYNIFSGKTDGESLSVDFVADKAGKYSFYITNCCAGLQNYDSASVEILNMT